MGYKIFELKEKLFVNFGNLKAFYFLKNLLIPGCFLGINAHGNFWQHILKKVTKSRKKWTELKFFEAN